MKIKTATLISLILITITLISSCGKNFSVNNPAVQKLTEKAQQLMEEGNTEGAISRLVSINDLNPELPENHYNLGIAYYKINEHEKAIDSLNRAINLNNNVKDAYYSLAVVHESVAITEINKLEEIKNNTEEKIETLRLIKENYTQAKNNFISYLDFDITNTEKEETLLKIEEISTEIEKTDESLLKLTPEEN